ncbi:TlyA family RNA methyltransferase [Phreatobacter stygius]|uniref:TlyA family RNA methyltransferase n=1 Tax=Phreatobacter stygius TaxID=1940610 RepID=A0A4D7B5X6_9HYPH|nr:TlyA family RNA methyltransferase [Phreatobacter stygius]QCI69319.1 TlyA family RNA methyltransferase [Phreatobacter stygius]
MHQGAKRRADILLVERGLFESRAKAQAAIAAGLVSADGRPVKKASDEIGLTAALSATAEHPWVSRGGVKLAHGLDVFGISPEGRVCLDIGASTGGFTQVLLERGAAQVTAVDTGRDQLHKSLRGRPDVTALEATDIRNLEPLDPMPDLGVVDVSFISLTLVLPAITALLAPSADLVALIKPQFEVGRGLVGKNGLVRDAAARDGAVEKIKTATAALGWTVTRVIDSPIAGGEGNREFLMHALRGSRP